MAMPCSQICWAGTPEATNTFETLYFTTDIMAPTANKVAEHDPTLLSAGNGRLPAAPTCHAAAPLAGQRTGARLTHSELNPPLLMPLINLLLTHFCFPIIVFLISCFVPIILRVRRSLFLAKATL